MPVGLIFTAPTPATVVAGGTSGLFTLTPSGAFTGGGVPTDSGAGGTFTPAHVVWSASSAPQTFVYNAPSGLGIKTIGFTPDVSSGIASVNPPTVNITVVSAAVAPQHLYQFPQIGGIPPFQTLFVTDQIPGANTPPPPTVTYTQGISPASGVVPATATLTYTLSAALSSSIVITPSATNGTFSPATVTIAAGGLTGTTTLTDNVAGASTISSTNSQLLSNPANVIFTGTNAPPPPVTYTQSIAPSSGIAPATATLTYTLSAALAANIVITPAATNGTFAPASVTIVAGSLTGTTTLTDAVVGVSVISSTNNSALANPASVTFTGTNTITSVTIGTVEAGAGTLAGIAAGAASVFVGPFQTAERRQMRVTVHLKSSVVCRLNYEFSTDKGTTWYVGQQIPSHVTTPDDATGYTNEATFNFEIGWWWRVSVYNSGAVAGNMAFAWRLHWY